MADSRSYPGAPRWVKLSALIGGALALCVVLLMLAGGGSGHHGPGRHISSRDAGGQTMPSSVTAAPPDGHGVGGHTPPKDSR